MSTSNYTPGTKLSYNNGTECCTVLTNGNSLVTRVWGNDHWEQMWLADWLILAEGTEQQDYIPLASKQEAEDDYSDMPPLVSLNHMEINQFWDDYSDMPPLVSMNDLEINQVWADLGRRSAELEARRKPAYPKRSNGTKLKWASSEDDETYRIAVVTKHGICQVKAITEGEGDCYFVGNKRHLTKRTFDSEASWREALPQGGDIFVY